MKKNNNKLSEVKKIVAKLIHNDDFYDDFYDLIVNGDDSKIFNTKLGVLEYESQEGACLNDAEMKTIFKLGDSFYSLSWVCNSWGSASLDFNEIEEVVQKEVTRTEWVNKDSE